MSSAATCTLEGRQITIDSWSSASVADVAPLVKASGKEQYWASGVGWTAFETDDSEIQLQLTNDAAALLKAGLAEATPTPDVAGEKTAADAVAKALDGSVHHFKE